MILCLQLCASLCTEGIVLVTRPSAREVLAQGTIVNTLVGIHAYLITIIQLGYASQGKQQGKRLLIACDILGLLLCGLEAVGIVIGKEGKHAVGIGIDPVLTKKVAQACKTMVPGIGLLVHA